MEQPLSSASSGEPLVAGGGLRQTLAQITDKVDRESLTSQLAPDCDGNKLKLLIGFAAVEIICVLAKLTLRVSGLSGIDKGMLNTMLVFDTAKYVALLVRNVHVNNWVVAGHRQSPNAEAFTRKNRLYDSTLGRQGDVVLELFMLLTIGTVLQAMSFQQLATSAEYQAGLMVFLSILAQALNMLTLVGLISIIDNAHLQIKTICQFMQLGQVVELVYDIAMHVIYTMGDTQGLEDVGDVVTSGSNSYHDLRIAGLLSLIAARVIAQSFFGFKKRLPLCVYCEVLHERVPKIGDGSSSGGGPPSEPLTAPTAPASG